MGTQRMLAVGVLGLAGLAMISLAGLGVRAANGVSNGFAAGAVSRGLKSDETARLNVGVEASTPKEGSSKSLNRDASTDPPRPSDENAAAKPCEFAAPGASFTIPHVASAPELNTDPKSKTWAKAASTWITKDCSHEINYPRLKTEVKGFWTDSDLYLLFVSPYTELNLWLPADNSKDRLKLWDRDVVEFFLGDDWQDIKKYKEFEIAPTGDWVDLAIDLNHDSYDAKWNSGWQRQGRIDEAKHIWYAAARVPLKAVTDKQVAAGTKWRVNLYRIDGLGEDPVRHFMCWQPTCVINRDPNHVPEHFGTLIFAK